MSDVAGWQSALAGPADCLRDNRPTGQIIHSHFYAQPQQLVLLAAELRAKPGAAA